MISAETWEGHFAYRIGITVRESYERIRKKLKFPYCFRNKQFFAFSPYELLIFINNFAYIVEFELTSLCLDL